MNTQRRRLRTMFAIALLTAMIVGLTASGQLIAPAGLDLSWNTADSGGGTSNGGTFSVMGTIGQPEPGPVMTGASFKLSGGFWPGVIRSCLADIAPGSGNGVVDIDDLVFVITNWGQPGGPADVTNNGIVNIDDLVSVITAWGMCPG